MKDCNESHRLGALKTIAGADRNHLDSCASCREYLAVHRALGSMAAESLEMSRMPPANTLVVRARILEKRRRLEEASRPMVVFQKVAYAILAGCWLVFAAMQWSPVVTWLGGIELSPVSGIESSGSLPLNFFWMLAALSVMTTMTMIHGIWTEEHA